MMHPSLLLVCLLLIPTALRAQTPAAPAGPLPTPRTGDDLSRRLCHLPWARRSRGAEDRRLGLTRRCPDFTDCAFATAEPDPDWQAVVIEGGPIRASIGTCRRSATRCRPTRSRWRSATCARSAESAWPRGDLNLPRAFFTEKAFPENESVWATTFSRRRARRRQRRSIYERRIGARNQIEVIVPIAFQQARDRRLDARPWRRRAGVQAHALCERARRGGSPRPGMEVILPTGQGGRSASATATPSSSRSRCGDRSCRATRSCRCTAASSCRRTTTRRQRRCSSHGGRDDPRPGPRIRPRLVAAGRGALGAA